MTIKSKSRIEITRWARAAMMARDPADWRPKTEQEHLNDIAEFNKDIRDTEGTIRALLKDAAEAKTAEDRDYFLHLLADCERILENQKRLRREIAERAGMADLYP